MVVLGSGTGTHDPADELRSQLRARVAAGSAEAMAVGAERIWASAAVGQYYRQTGFQSVWTGPEGPSPHADSLLSILREAHRDGLRADDYHVSMIDSLGQHLRARGSGGQSMDPGLLADFELLCTDAFLLYGSHLLSGRVDPVQIVPTWTLNRREKNLVQRLQEVHDGGSIRALLDGVRPSQPEYDAFRRALGRYRDIAARGGWPTVPAGPTLKEGMQDERVPLLRRRLQATGDLSEAVPSDPLLFDDTLRRAVARFQERYGLEIDGVVGPDTRSAMNVPVEARIRQIEVNLERWRWLPQDLGDPYVLVNIADFWLRLVEGGRDVLQMRVVVGTQYRQTPVFSDQISYLVFNPYWHVPARIAAEDKLPEFQEDPGLVARLGYDVFDGWGADATQVDPATIDWKTLSASNFPYRLRQRPGPANALGRVKFMFPNTHNVYLHDTPSRSHFHQTARSFSSGCIRVEHPVELAAYLLRHNDGWTEKRIRAVMEQDTEQGVVLKRKVPVHLLYWTAWMEDEDTLHFRPDIYGRDEAVASALTARLAPLANRSPGQ